MFDALSDFIIHCRVERRLSELTCRAYERDVRACIEFLDRQTQLGPDKTDNETAWTDLAHALFNAKEFIYLP